MRERKLIQFMSRLLTVALCILILVAGMSGSEAYANPAAGSGGTLIRQDTYSIYLERHTDAARPQEPVVIPVNQYSSSDMALEVLRDFEGSDGLSLKTLEEGYVEWEIDVPSSGLYNLYIEYFPIEGRSAAIEREVWINGEAPFAGARHILFSRVWADAFPIRQDSRGNDLRPRQIEKPSWQTSFFNDYMGYYNEPYLFYFEAGPNTLRLESVKEPMVIHTLMLTQAPEVLPYVQVSRVYAERGYPVSSLHFDMIQGEHANFKSDPTLYAIFDRTSPATIPYDKSKIRLNTIGGYRWVLPGQWIEWEFEVPKTGLYQISIKARQNIIRGLYSNRRLTIDGQVPFKEMRNLTFTYQNSWLMYTLGDEEEPYLFYLEEGTRRLRLEVVLGDLAEILRVAEDSVFSLNMAYRRIMMITGSTPDQFRDYQLDRQLPDVMRTLLEQSRVMAELSDKLHAYTGQRGSHNAILDRLSFQLQDMANRPRTIQRRLNEFRDNVGALGTWILFTREQPLEIDYFVVHSPDKLDALPAADVGFFPRVLHEFRAFLASFTEDYDSIGDVFEDSDNVITVWIGTGRDQAQVLKEMIDDTFTPASGIPVNLQLVQQGVLLPATVAGMGPDVAMQVFAGEPVNYATRNAVVDLKQFPDFDEVATRFRESALEPYLFNNGIFALPEQQMFPMLFYRKDILDELGLDVPQTWEDVFDILPEIQKNHMHFGIPVSEIAQPWGGMVSYTTLLFQREGDLYYRDGKASALDADVAIDAFRKWTGLYVNYKLPLQFNIVNRFRTGEIPIAINEFWLYNVLQVFAPELRGLWEFAPIPGTMMEDGTINRSAPSGGTGVMMMKAAQDKKAAWDFMKWWTDSETQVRFAREMESLMGAAARYPTANVEALRKLPWPVRDYNALNAQGEWIRGIPEVPGGYFTPRHLDNAFRRVVFSGDNARETLLDFVRIINEEIEHKRREFGLPLREMGGR